LHLSHIAPLFLLTPLLLRKLPEILFQFRIGPKSPQSLLRRHTRNLNNSLNRNRRTPKRRTRKNKNRDGKNQRGK